MGARRLSRELRDHVERVNGAMRHPLTFDYTLDAPGRPAQGYSAGDHRMYCTIRIPSVFLSSPLPADYHQVTDEAQYLDYHGFAYATEFTHDLVVALANAPRRPTVDGPKPEPASHMCGSEPAPREKRHPGFARTDGGVATGLEVAPARAGAMAMI